MIPVIARCKIWWSGRTTFSVLMSRHCSPDCACSLEVSGWMPSKRCAPDRIWTCPSAQLLLANFGGQVDGAARRRGSPPLSTIGDSARIRPGPLRASRAQPGPGSTCERGISKWPNDVLDRWRDPMKRMRSRCWTATSTISAPHIFGLSNTLTSTRRYAWSPGSGSIRSGACMPRSTSWADVAIALPEAVHTIATRSPLVSQPTAGLYEATSKEPSNSVSGPSPLLINSPIDGSGLAERALGNAWFYRGDYRTRRRMDGSHDRIREERLARPPRARVCTCDPLPSPVSATMSEVTNLRRRPRTQPPSPDRPLPLPKPSTPKVLPSSRRARSKPPVELQRAADIAREAGNRWIQAFALTEVLWLEARQGRPAKHWHATST